MKRTLGLTLLLFATLFLVCAKKNHYLRNYLVRNLLCGSIRIALYLYYVLCLNHHFQAERTMLLGHYCWHKPGIRYMVNAFRIR